MMPINARTAPAPKEYVIKSTICKIYFPPLTHIALYEPVFVAGAVRPVLVAIFQADVEELVAFFGVFEVELQRVILSISGKTVAGEYFA